MASTSFTMKITHTGEVKQVTEKFKKTEVFGILQPESKFPVHLKVTGKQDKAEEVARFNVDDVVYFECEIDGRLWEKEDKRNVFMDLAVINYRIMQLGKPRQEDVPADRYVPPTHLEPVSEAQFTLVPDTSEDLPF